MSDEKKLPIIQVETDIAGELDTSDPRSLINLLPAWLKKAVLDFDPAFFDLSEPELLEEINKSVTFTYLLGSVNHLRIALFDEYDRVQRLRLPEMDFYRVISGICTIAFLKKRIITSPILTAYLLKPSLPYENNLKHLHQLGLQAAKAALSLSPILPNGQPNVKLIDAQTKLMQHIDMRLKGAIIQRVENTNKNLNVNVDTKAGDLPTEAAKTLTLAQIEEKINDLRKRSERLSAPSVVEVDMMKNITPSSTQLATLDIDAEKAVSDKVP